VGFHRIPPLPEILPLFRSKDKAIRLNHDGHDAHDDSNVENVVTVVPSWLIK